MILLPILGWYEGLYLIFPNDTKLLIHLWYVAIDFIDDRAINFLLVT